jgi:hypothetical protein
VRRAPVLLPAALCALVAHAALYGSLTPADGAHRYLRWYEPAVAGLSAAAVAVWCVLVALGLAGRIAAPPTSARRVATWAGGLLWLQESLERSLSAHTPAVATFAPTQWLAVLAALAVASVVLARAIGAGRRLARALVDRGRVPLAPRLRPAATANPALRRFRPLATAAAMRAPPLPLPS